jgi:uncharacterized protein
MDYTLMVVLGLVAGVLGGLLGIGGSVVMIPGMVWILGQADASGIEQIQQYQAAAMIVNFLLAGPSALRHLRAGAVYGSVWRWLAPSAGVGIIAGVLLSQSALFAGGRAVYLRYLFGAFLLYAVGYNLYRLLRPPRVEGITREQADTAPRWKKASIGGVMGVFAGLLGIGGGAQAVPLMQVVLRMPLRKAIATSSATIFTIAWIGAAVKNLSLGPAGSVERSFVLAALLTPTAMVGGYLGGALTHVLPLRVVRAVVVGLMLLAAWKMFAG